MNVVAPALKEELIDVVDETIDVSITKQLCIIVQYWSETKKNILIAFVDLIFMTRTCVDNPFNTIKDCLAGINLTMEDGNGASVWSRLIAVALHHIKVKCIYHSLALGVELPSSLGFFLAEIP